MSLLLRADTLATCKFRISVTLLVAFMSCQMEYYFSLLNLKTEDPSMAQLLENGKLVHSKLFNKHYVESTSVMTLDEAIEQTLLDKKPRTVRELLLRQKIFLDETKTTYCEIIGRIDEVRIEYDRIVIIDDKNSDSISDYWATRYKHQLELYCFLFFEKYFPFVPIYYELRQAQTKDKIFLHGEFNVSHIHTYNWYSAIESLIEYWKGEIKLDKTSSSNFCKACRFNNSICEGMEIIANK